MSRALAAVLSGLLAFASPAVLAYDNDGTTYFFNNEAEANAARVWRCKYYGTSYGNAPFFTVSGDLGTPATVEGCLAAAQIKVIELSNAWHAGSYLGSSGVCTPPLREGSAGRAAIPNLRDPATGLVISVYQYGYSGSYTSSCAHIASTSGGDRQTARLEGIATITGPDNPYNPGKIAIRYIPLIRKCPVNDIPPFGPPDPPDLDMTKATAKTRKAADCLLGKLGLTNLGDAELISSGYRSVEYQQHFTALWDKRKELENNHDPLCAALKAKIAAHIQTHDLGKFEVRPPPDPTNCHTAGTCFDINSRHIPAVDRNSIACGVKRTLKDRDKWHVVPQ